MHQTDCLSFKYIALHWLMILRHTKVVAF